jgi:hypothetical protein
MAYHAMRIFSEKVRREEVGAFWTRKVTRMVERGMTFRESRGSGQITDVLYYDLVEEPMRAVERVYQDASMSLPDEARRSMQEQRDANHKHRHGVHHYRLEDFGVDRSRADAGFAKYRARFRLPYEGG